MEGILLDIKVIVFAAPVDNVCAEPNRVVSKLKPNLLKTDIIFSHHGKGNGINGTPVLPYGAGCVCVS
jgi:hypothetical protein